MLFFFIDVGWYGVTIITVVTITIHYETENNVTWLRLSESVVT